MPDVSAALDRAIALVAVGDVDSVQNAFCRHNLIRSHDEQQPVGTEYTISGQQIEQRMFGKERTAESHQIGNRLVIGICPPRGKFKTVARLPALGFVVARSLFDMALACGVAVILGIGAV